MIKWKQGTRFRTDPKKAHLELERIREKNGGDIPLEAVVQRARSTRCCLHREFEWDDKKAAHQHRLGTARKIVGSIEIVREELPERQSRAYEAVIHEAPKGDEPKWAYRRTEDILQDPVKRGELLTRALNELQACRRRFADLSELAHVWQAVDATITELGKRAG